MAAPKFGSALRDCDKVVKAARRDLWPDVPFVEDEPPADGLLALWGVCTSITLLFSAYLIWGPK